jgi:hypothetical protein
MPTGSAIGHRIGVDGAIPAVAERKLDQPSCGRTKRQLAASDRATPTELAAALKASGQIRTRSQASSPVDQTTLAASRLTLPHEHCLPPEQPRGVLGEPTGGDRRIGGNGSDQFALPRQHARGEQDRPIDRGSLRS